MRRILFSAALVLLPTACSEDVDPPGGGAGGGTSAASGGDPGEPLAVLVPDTGRVFVKLDPPAIVTPTGDGAASTAWDIAFEGFGAYSNSGPSGVGEGGAFGPLDAAVFTDGATPQVPFLVQDATGGAFVSWYLYEDASHALWSRFHVYGVRDGARLWKVQILGYYGDLNGAPVSALYQVRYAEVFAGSVGPTQALVNLDGTAGGLDATDGATSACVDLGTGTIVALTPDAARASTAWHLCFRRDTISVNGELGGPRGIAAVDLEEAGAASEATADIKARTAASTQPRFDAVTYADLTDAKLAYHGDRVVSAFSDHWIDRESSPLAPVSATWLVAASDGGASHLITFDGFNHPSARSPGTVRLRHKIAK